jgi:hypothetical protein
VVGDGARVISPLERTGGNAVRPKMFVVLAVVLLAALGWAVYRRRAAPTPAA